MREKVNIIGRWVAFPNARMSGRVRKIVESGHAPNVYICEDVEMPEGAHPTKRMAFNLKGKKAFKTKELAEKWCRDEEARAAARFKDWMRRQPLMEGQWINEGIAVNYADIAKRMSQMGETVVKETTGRRSEAKPQVIITGKPIGELAASEICKAFGMDEVPSADAEFWAKHDKARHKGHFDPATMTCKLREAYKNGARIADLHDSMEDDMLPSDPTVKLQATNSPHVGINDLLRKKFPTLSEKHTEEILKLFTDKGHRRIASRVSAEEFHNALTEAKASQPKENAWRVDIHPVDDYQKMKCYKTVGGSTFAINGTDIVSVCKRVGDKVSARQLIEEAVEAGGNKLDSYDGNHGFYRYCGFEPVSWTKFAAEYAPEDALPEDVVFYKYTGDGKKMPIDEATLELGKFKASRAPLEYDKAQAERDAEL